MDNLVPIFCIKANKLTSKANELKANNQYNMLKYSTCTCEKSDGKNPFVACCKEFVSLVFAVFHLFGTDTMTQHNVNAFMIFVY